MGGWRVQEGWYFSDRYRGHLPDIDYLVGSATATGIHHFSEDQVVAAFERASK
jgi:hypothetical protein